ncbi:MAG: hypothetical protein JJT78_08680 [Leptospira sp.]|nr:hypothetical protein [Leptospira sp.]
MRNRFLLFQSFFKPLDYKKSIFSTVISKNAVDLESIWNDFNFQFHPYPKVFEFGRAICNRKIHIHHEVVGKSKIEVSIHIRAEYFPENILLRLFNQLILNQINWEIDRIQEFLEFMKGNDFHENFLELKNYKKPKISPNGFVFYMGYVWGQYIPYRFIENFLPESLNAKKNSSQNVRIQAIHIPIHSVRFDLWDEEFELDKKPELIDIFVEAFETFPLLKAEPMFIYLGSIYSHREIGNICKNLIMERKLLPSYLMKNIQLPMKESRLTTKIPVNPLCRIREYSGTYTVSRNSNESIFFCIQKGVYNLSKNEMDHAPIEKIDLFF